MFLTTEKELVTQSERIQKSKVRSSSRPTPNFRSVPAENAGLLKRFTNTGTGYRSGESMLGVLESLEIRAQGVLSAKPVNIYEPLHFFYQ